MPTSPQSKIYQLYCQLSERYGTPRDCWSKWCCRRKTQQDREEIALGAMLTQRINWLNVEMALNNLREVGILSINGVYQLGRKDLRRLEKLIKPTGFYKQKAQRVFSLCQFIVENHGDLKGFCRQELPACRQQLLGIYGIGPETADSILLYAGDKLAFVIDEYTRRFVKQHNLARNLSYDYLKDLFQNNLPQELRVYQDFHAMIVLQGRGVTWDLVSRIS